MHSYLKDKYLQNMGITAVFLQTSEFTFKGAGSALIGAGIYDANEVNFI
jgi:hypothetical protein